MKRLVLLFALIASPVAAADVCDDLWFTRNLIMDRAGYCFGSTLGQAVFDNGNCIGKSVSLSAQAQRQVAEIRELEKVIQCKVDTGKTSLDLPDIETRRKLIDLPVRDEFESGCIGWQLDFEPLHAGHDGNSAIIGRVEPEDDILWSHRSQVEGWDYVMVMQSGWGSVKSAGWMRSPTDEKSCRQWAG